jgi:hypothetical protein
VRQFHDAHLVELTITSGYPVIRSQSSEDDACIRSTLRSDCDGVRPQVCYERQKLMAIVEGLKQEHVFFAPVITNDNLFGTEWPTLPPGTVAPKDFKGVAFRKP